MQVVKVILTNPNPYPNTNPNPNPKPNSNPNPKTMPNPIILTLTITLTLNQNLTLTLTLGEEVLFCSCLGYGKLSGGFYADTPKSPDATESGRLSTGEIVGISVGAALVSGLVGGYFLRKTSQNFGNSISGKEPLLA